MKLLTFVALMIICNASQANAWWDGVIDTVETTHESGQLREQYQIFTYGGNERTYKYGFYRLWHENGRVFWEGQFEGDNKTGCWVRYDSTGCKRQEVSYHVGLKHGAEFEWHSNSSLVKALYFRNDVLHGLCTWYRSTNTILDGFNNPCTVILRQGFYLNGELLLPITADTGRPCIDGLIGGREPYYNAELDLWVEWDKNKTNFSVGRKIDESKHGYWISWSATGDMREASYYESGNPLE